MKNLVELRHSNEVRYKEMDKDSGEGPNTCPGVFDFRLEKNYKQLDLRGIVIDTSNNNMSLHILHNNTTLLGYIDSCKSETGVNKINLLRKLKSFTHLSRATHASVGRIIEPCWTDRHGEWDLKNPIPREISNHGFLLNHQVIRMLS